MQSIDNLPLEVLDKIFDYLSSYDRKNAHLVCRRWNEQLCAPHFINAEFLRYTNYVCSVSSLAHLLRAASQGRYTRIVLNVEKLSVTPPNYNRSLAQLLEASGSSLVELSLAKCTLGTFVVAFQALRGMHRLEQLCVYGGIPKLPSAIFASAGLTCVTDLKIDLRNARCANLVLSLANQLTSLTVRVMDGKKLLLRCLKKLDRLKSLALEEDWLRATTVIELDDLGESCWRLLAQLESFCWRGSFLLRSTLPDILRHCQNLKRLALNCQLYNKLVPFEEINMLKGLQKLELELPDGLYLANKDCLDPPELNLPTLEHLHVASAINIRLSKQLPKLTSLTVTDPRRIPKHVLSEVLKIDGIGDRRFRKILFKSTSLEGKLIDLLGSLSMDVLAFEHCHIDCSIFNVLANPEARQKIGRITLSGYRITSTEGRPDSIRTVAELREKVPYIQISEKWGSYEY